VPLLIALSVLLVGALVAGVVYFVTRKNDPVPTAGTATPTPTVTLSPSATATESPSATGTPSATATGPSDSQAPSDPAAQRAADEFMSDLQDQMYNLAWVELCDAGKKRFADGTALQKELGLDRKQIGDYRITKVVPKVFNGDPRKEVSVTVTYKPTGNDTLTLSITQEHGGAKICGF
jgi:hypothetical protein